MPVAFDKLQCCMGAILEAAQRGSHKEVMSGLYNARAGVLSLLPAIAGQHCCFCAAFTQLPTVLSVVHPAVLHGSAFMHGLQWLLMMLTGCAGVWQLEH
jgi:hypothetical protein